MTRANPEEDRWALVDSESAKSTSHSDRSMDWVLGNSR